MKKWWLQFHAESGVFNGIAVVQAKSFVGAVQTAYAIGCSPGGIVSGVCFPEGVDGPETRLPLNTLFSREDLEGEYGIELKTLGQEEAN